MTSYRLSIVTFALGRATILNVTDDDRWMQHCTNSATVSTIG